MQFLARPFGNYVVQSHVGASSEAQSLALDRRAGRAAAGQLLAILRGLGVVGREGHGRLDGRPGRVHLAQLTARDGEIVVQPASVGGLLSAVYDDMADTLTLTYFVDDDESGNYPLRVQFFLADANGQGMVYLGSDTFTTTDYGNGFATIVLYNVTSLGVDVDEEIVATATTDGDDTSAFSATVTVT